MGKMEPVNRQVMQFVACLADRLEQLRRKVRKLERSWESIAGDPHIERLIRNVETLDGRFKTGDYRCDDVERGKLPELAGWILTKWHELNGTPVPSTPWTTGKDEDPDVRRHGKEKPQGFNRKLFDPFSLN